MTQYLVVSESTDVYPCLVYDSQTNAEIIDDIEVPNESKGETEFQSIDECKTVDLQDELELWEPVEIPDMPTRIVDEQVIEDFMIEEEEIESQGLDKCKTVELQDKQEIEEYLPSGPIEMPDIPMRVIEEQKIEESIKEEECIKEISDMTLPEMCSAKVRIHKSETKLGLPIIKDICRMQNESKLVQNMTMNCDTPMQIHETTQSLTEQMMPLPDRDIPGKLITHASWEETLRKEITPYKGSMCRPLQTT